MAQASPALARRLEFTDHNIAMPGDRLLHSTDLVGGEIARRQARGRRPGRRAHEARLRRRLRQIAGRHQGAHATADRVHDERRAQQRKYLLAPPRVHDTGARRRGAERHVVRPDLCARSLFGVPGGRASAAERRVHRLRPDHGRAGVAQGEPAVGHRPAAPVSPRASRRSAGDADQARRGWSG
jgi:hypothetical protein